MIHNMIAKVNLRTFIQARVNNATNHLVTGDNTKRRRKPDVQRRQLSAF